MLQEALFVCLLIIVFVIMLNGFLNGALKNRIDAALSVALLGVLAVIFYCFGWKGLGIGIALCLIAGTFFRPLARRLAMFLYSHPPKRRR